MSAAKLALLGVVGLATLGLAGCVDDLPALAACQDHRECGGGRGCGIDGVCRATCVANMQCAAGEACVVGLCQTPQCGRDEDCPGDDTICQMGACVPQECEEDRDCEDSDEVCDDHRCVEGEGEGEGDAASPPEAAPPPDRGVDDAGVADTGAADGGPDLDVSIADATIPDAGMADAALPDAAVDAAPPAPDAGVADPLTLLPVDPLLACTLEAYDPFDDGEATANPNGIAGAPSVIGAAAQLSEAAGILSLTAPAAGGAYGLRWPGGLLPLGGQIGVRVTRLDLVDDADTALEVGFTYANNGQLSGHQGLWAAAVLVPTGTPGEFRLRVDQRGPDGTVTEGTPSVEIIALANAPLPLDVVFEAGMVLNARVHRANAAHALVSMATADNQLGLSPQPGGPNAYPAVQLRATGEDGPASLAWMVTAHCTPPMMVP